MENDAVKVRKVKPGSFQAKLKPSRAEQIQRLKDLFRLTFRVDFDCQDQLECPGDEMYFYDIEGEFYTAPLAINGTDADEAAEMAEFAAKFRALRAQKVFKELCVEYYGECLAHLKNTALRYTRELRSGRTNKNQNKYDITLGNLENNRKQQIATAAKLRKLAAADQVEALSNEFDPDKRVAFLTQKLQKLTQDNTADPDEILAIEQEITDLGTQNTLAEIYRGLEVNQTQQQAEALAK